MYDKYRKIMILEFPLIKCNALDIVNNMATPRQHVVHADRKDGAIDQNAKPHATVTESADERWNRKKENVKSKWIFISFMSD